MTQLDPLVNDIKQRIESAIPNSHADVVGASSRHYSLTVVSDAFIGLSQVKQHQLVYATITDLMKGDDAPIHAIDKMDLHSTED